MSAPKKPIIQTPSLLDGEQLIGSQDRVIVPTYLHFRDQVKNTPKSIDAVAPWMTSLLAHNMQSTIGFSSTRLIELVEQDATIRDQLLNEIHRIAATMRPYPKIVSALATKGICMKNFNDQY